MNDEVTLTHTVAGGGYDGVEASSVVVTVSDNDRGVTVSETALTVDEEDTTGSSYTVVLDAEPTGEVTVTVGGHAGTDLTVTPGSLTFTTGNWDDARTVTVTAADDADAVNDEVTLTTRRRRVRRRGRVVGGRRWVRYAWRRRALWFTVSDNDRGL